MSCVTAHDTAGRWEMKRVCPYVLPKGAVIVKPYKWNHKYKINKQSIGEMSTQNQQKAALTEDLNSDSCVGRTRTLMPPFNNDSAGRVSHLKQAQAHPPRGLW